MTTINEAIQANKPFELKAADTQFLEELQARLKSLNYYFSAVDGIYGNMTAGAWAQFKSDYHQSSPDLVGAASLKFLRQAQPRALSHNAPHYAQLWYNAYVKDHAACDEVINQYFLPHQKTYQAIEDNIGVPWYVTACLHYREADCDFTCHLFNGDPLSDRTYNVPAGQPVHGNPPFSWAYSATCALQYDGLDQVKNWSIESLLYQSEKFNGMGYYNMGINSPYLWANTNQYQSGKYVSDGRYSASAVDEQLGVVSLLKRMQERKIISLY